MAMGSDGKSEETSLGAGELLDERSVVGLSELRITGDMMIVIDQRYG